MTGQKNVYTPKGPLNVSLSTQTLCVSNNRIPSFEGLGMLPNLRILSVSNNLVSDYKFFPFLPSLYVRFLSL